MAKKCKVCGYDNREDYNYCVRCGTLLPGMYEMDVVRKDSYIPKDDYIIVVKERDEERKKAKAFEEKVINFTLDEIVRNRNSCPPSGQRKISYERLSPNWFKRLGDDFESWMDKNTWWLTLVFVGIAVVCTYLVKFYGNDAEKITETIEIVKDRNTGKFGIYDNKTNALVTPYEYDSISHRKGHNYQGTYRNYFYLYKNGKIGVADSTGKISINCELDATEGAYNGVIILQKGDKQGLMDCYGHQIIPFEYQYVLWQSKPRITLGTPGTYVGRIIPVKRDNNSGWELYNRNGRKIRGQHYRLATQTGNPSLIKVVEDRRDYKYLYGIVDESGQIVIPCKYYNMSTFYNDRAWVKEKYNDSWSLIDTKGERIITLAKDYTPRSFSEGLAAIQYKKKVGFCDTSGKIVIPMDYELTMIKENEYHAPSFYEGKARVSYNGIAGYIDKNGKFTAEVSVNK